MKFLTSGSIRKHLTMLVMLAVVPALVLLLYTGMEQRRQSIETAKRDLLFLTHTMVESQKEITASTRQILSTLSLLPEVQTQDRRACRAIFRAVLERNPDYLNIALTDLSGDVLVSGRTFTAANLGDRKHFRDALTRKDFAVGEYIISRVGSTAPAFAFAYPVLDKLSRATAVLTITIKLAHFSRFFDVQSLPERSFVAVTDHLGIRLFYYPPNEQTNPIGKTIKADSWTLASASEKPGVFVSAGSDGTRRMFAFEQVRLAPDDSPYIYVWAGIPEAQILEPANAALRRNMLLMLLATILALVISWMIGKNTLISPIQRLVVMTRKFAEGDIQVSSDQADEQPNELGALMRAFHDMAEALTISQRTLRENEGRFRLLMHSLDALVYVADMHTYEVLFINEYGKKMLGDATGKICWQSLQKGQEGPCSFCSNKYLLDGDGKPGAIYTWEFQNTVSGQWFHIRDRAIRWVDGRIVRLEIATDISERKLAEAKLAEETERLAVTLRSIGDGVITTDTHGRVVLTNKVAETLTGWGNQEAAGRPLAEVFNIINGETRQPCESPVGNILRAGQITSLMKHTVLISRTGQERQVADSGAPIRGKDGRIIGVVLVFRDITEQLRTEQELIKIKKLESIGLLAGGIAHDFNNLLAAILGNIDLSRRDPHLTDKTQRFLDEASKASFRARDLTRQLLTFAKGGEPIKEAASLAGVVKDSADFILRGEQIACRYAFPDDLWTVDIDKGQISQVVQNIILNARHAMPNGGVIEVSCENVQSAGSLNVVLPKDRKYVKMAITDSGIGMPANVLDRIFDPYFSTKQHGSGLGLAITHSIVSKHGGHISVRSTAGVGTTFTVYLPASVQQGAVQVRTEETTGPFGRKSRIMVVDDEEQVRNVTQAMLHEMGHEVVLAKDGEEALRLYGEARDGGDPVDLVLMDLTMPGGMGGKEAVRRILAMHPEAKVIVSSGYSNDPVMANFREHGFCGAIVKPFQVAELSRILSVSC